MKNFILSLFSVKRRTAKKCESNLCTVKHSESYEDDLVKKVNNSPEVENFVKLMRTRDFEELNNLLKTGFNTNSEYKVLEHFSYDNGAINGGYSIISYRLIELEIVNTYPALEKLLRHYGAKTRLEEEREEWQKERGQELEKVNKLIG